LACQHGPVHGLRDRVAQPVLAHVADDADDFSPRLAFAGRAQPFAERRRGLAPEIARQAFRNDDDGPIVVEIGPRIIAPCDERHSKGREHARRDALGAASDRVRRAALDFDRLADRIEAVHRDVAREADRRDAGQRAERFDELLLTPRDLHWIRHLAGAHGDSQRLHLLGLRKARRDGTQRGRRSHRKAGCNQHDDGERDLADDERMLEPLLTAPAARRSAAGVQPFVQPARIHTRGDDGADQRTRQQRGHQGDCDDVGIERDFAEPRQCLGPDRNERSQAGRSDRKSRETTEQPHGDTLEDRGATQAPDSRAERRSHRKLVLSHRGPDQEQVRDVGASDHEHDADRDHDDPQQVTDLADDVLLQRAHGRRDAPDIRVDARVAARGRRPRLLPERDHARDVGVRVCDGHPGLQTRDPEKREVRQLRLDALELHRAQQQIGFGVGYAKPRRHHPGDLAQPCIDVQRAPHDARVAAETALPIAVAQHDLRNVAGLASGEPTADQRLNAERLEHADGDGDPRHLLRLAFTNDRRSTGRPDAEVLEDAVLLREGEKHRPRQRQPAAVERPSRAGGVEPHRDELAGLRICERLEQDTVHDGERRRGRATADRERRDGDGRDRGAGQQRTQSVAAVGKERAQHAAIPLPAIPRDRLSKRDAPANSSRARRRR
jgi:hypothetical protein